MANLTLDITKLFKRWFVPRPHGMCQILFPLTALDDFTEEIITVAKQHESYKVAWLERNLATAKERIDEVAHDCADLEQRLREATQARRDMRMRAVITDNSLCEARELIAELAAQLPLDSGAGLGNELEAWEAASDEALSRFEEGLEREG